MKTFKNTIDGIRTAALLMVMLVMASLLPAARAQSDLTIRPLGLGTVTNTSFLTNYYNVGSLQTSNVVTNIVITPNYNPSYTNVAIYVQWGANLPLLAGSPGVNPNNSLAVVPGVTMINGWIRIPPNVDFTLVTTLGALNTSNVTQGFDLSDDALSGTTNCPVQVTITPIAGTNTYYNAINRTNFLGAAYFRWDLLTSTGTQSVTVNTNKLDYRTGKIEF
jgi:hypothetical protein